MLWVNLYYGCKYFENQERKSGDLQTGAALPSVSAANPEHTAAAVDR